eukprot:GILK01014025.1.p1 GENE.GILK01014025.1~~GILK01014025.1.p1  ORF type:complete len:161 (+),score=27.30 GILK01014025.1:65-547(+)
MSKMAMRSAGKTDKDTERKVFEYEKFVDERLKQDLKNVLDDRDKLYEQIAQYLQLRNNITVIKENQLKQMKTMVNLGCDFYAQAEVADTSFIFVNVGLGFHLQFTLDEALIFIEKKEQALNTRAELLTRKASEIKAHIKVFLEAIAELLQLPGRSAPSPI